MQHLEISESFKILKKSSNFFKQREKRKINKNQNHQLLHKIVQKLIMDPKEIQKLAKILRDQGDKLLTSEFKFSVTGEHNNENNNNKNY